MNMEFGGLFVAGLVWLVFKLIADAVRGANASDEAELPQEPVSPPIPVIRDPTQHEGIRLMLALQEFQHDVKEARRSLRPPRSSREESAERGSLEAEPEVSSLEGEVRREARVEVDQDELAEQIIARRRSAAAARDTVRSTGDHAEFDQRIRQQPADKTAVHGYTTKQLRDAIVWQEILGPPVSLRNDSGGGH
jgi:hypothetical protein